MKLLIALLILCCATFASADPTADITITYRPGNGPDVTATIFSHNLSTYATIPIDISEHTTWLVTVTSQDRDHNIPTGRPFWIQVMVSNPAIVLTQKDASIPLEIAQTLFRFDLDRQLKFFESSAKGELTIKFSNFAQ